MKIVVYISLFLVVYGCRTPKEPDGYTKNEVNITNQSNHEITFVSYPYGVRNEFLRVDDTVTFSIGEKKGNVAASPGVFEGALYTKPWQDFFLGTQPSTIIFDDTLVFDFFNTCYPECDISLDITDMKHWKIDTLEFSDDAVFIKLDYVITEAFYSRIIEGF